MRTRHASVRRIGALFAVAALGLVAACSGGGSITDSGGDNTTASTGATESTVADTSGSST